MTTNKSKFIAAVAAIVVAGMAAGASAWEFRGIELDQGGNALIAPTLERGSIQNKPYYVDVSDSFSRDGNLANSQSDGWQVGFVPPAENLPSGPLSAGYDALHGQWMSSHANEYMTSTTNGGRVQRATGDGVSVTCLPWVVEEGLGDFYHIEMTANVAEGESVQLGYFGDINEFGAAQGLAGELGQLVLGIERGSGTESEELTWTVSWDMEGNRQQFSATYSDNVPVGEEIKLQLGWLDDNANGNDLFDAWLETSNGNTRLAEGNMATDIDVFGIGFEFSGTGSYGTGFAAAVPEPATGGLLMFGMIGLVGATRRRG